MERVLITGGTGFVGLAAAEALAGRGAEIVLFSPEPAPAEFGVAPWMAKVVDVVQGDVRSADDLARALAWPVTHILHAAALTPDAARESAEPERIVSVNIGGTVSLVQAAAMANPRARIVVLSSVAVYGFADPGAHGLYEEAGTHPAPETLYGITKLAAEQAARRLAELYGLDLAAIRLGPVFGPWEHRSGARDTMSPHRQVLEAARARVPCRLPRPMRADWLYSRDAGTAIAAILLESTKSRLFNVGGGAMTDVAQWCLSLTREFPDLDWSVPAEGATGAETPTIRYGLRRDRPGLDTARLIRETSFRHHFDMNAAAQDCVAWSRVYDPP
jgi:nucleoside-diphosphate-sugar epimerase